MFLTRLKLLLKTLFYLQLSNFNKALKSCKMLVESDLTPFAKKADYNKIVEKIAERMVACRKIEPKKVDISGYKTRVLLLNSEIYDSGGHTQMAIQFAEAFAGEYEIFVYLTNFFDTKHETAPVKSAVLQGLAAEYYKSQKSRLDEKVVELYDYIIRRKITTINVNMHMQDVVSCAVLYLLKKHTNINIIFWNHGSHWYSLATCYAKKIVFGCKNGEIITPYLRGQENVISLPFLMTRKVEANVSKPNLKESLGIPQEAFVTLTGCGREKLGAEYFELIRRILQSNERIYHIWVGGAGESDAECKINSKRFVKTEFSPDFDSFIAACDLYIDSFPQGSALTLVDCIRQGKPVVIKINEEFRFKSFEEYLCEGYELASVTSEGMFAGVTRLASDKAFYSKMRDKVLTHYKNTYTLEVAKPLYEKLIV